MNANLSAEQKRRPLLIKSFIVVSFIFVAFMAQRMWSSKKRTDDAQKEAEVVRLSKEYTEKSVELGLDKAKNSPSPSVVTAGKTIAPSPIAPVAPAEEPGAAAVPDSVKLAKALAMGESVPQKYLRARRRRMAPLINRSLLESAMLFADFNTSLGNFSMRLFHHKAPKTVENFIDLVEGTKKSGYITSSDFAGEPFYDGLLIFRTARNAFVQMGDPLNSGKGVTYFIESEASTPAFEIDAGMVVMAQLGAQTSGTQFFIALTDMSDLLGAVNIVFGRITSGYDVVKKIAAVKVDIYDRPLGDVVIKHITLRQELKKQIMVAGPKKNSPDIH